MSTWESEEKTHYHLIATWPGCLPEYNEVYTSEGRAREAFKEYLSAFDEEEFDYKDGCTAILRKNLRIFVEECKGCGNVEGDCRG